MLLTQILQSVWFYLVFSFCAGAGLFFTAKIFPNNFSLAYFSAKPLGLAAVGYLVWFLSSFKFLDYQNNFLVLGLFVVIIFLGWFKFLTHIKEQKALKQPTLNLKNILLLEAVSLTIFLAYLYLRAFGPAAYGTERFMDMALLNSSLKAQSFPFIDPWYAGKLVNYYYYGHYLISLLTKATGLSSFLTYNYALGLLYSTSSILPALLVYDITKSKSFAGLSGFLVTTAGSLFYSGCVLNTWLKGQDICSYASSTRLYSPSYIINEIPSYSFTVGDLHAHFLALPFFILNLILIYALSQSQKVSQFLSYALLIGVVTSALINPSDVTTLALMLTVLWLYKVFLIFKNSNFNFKKLLTNEDFQNWLNLALLLILLGVAFYMPFLANFKSPVLGFGFAPYFALKHNLLSFTYQYPTPFLALLGMWGFFILGIVLSLYYLRKSIREHLFPILLLLTGVFLIIFVELFYVKDIYHIANPPYFRANTVFKYGYHTWTVLALSFSVLVAEAFAKLKNFSWGRSLVSSLKIIMGIFILAGLVYPVQAIDQFYLAAPTYPLNLDAADFMHSQSEGDWLTVSWIRQNIKGRPVILEAVGDSYSYFGRISVFTGDITPMGWKSHEWTWRFDGSKAEVIKAKDPSANVETGYGAVANIESDVKQIYESSSVDTANLLLKKYGVGYVYIGDKERETYPDLVEAKFNQLGNLVFQSGGSKLYQIH